MDDTDRTNIHTSMTPVTSNKTKASLSSYATLLKQIRQAIEEGKARASKAVERELVRSKWETGKLILDHMLLNKDRADYGKKVIQRLSVDLGTSKRELDYMVAFARAQPIVPPAAQLNWASQRELLSVREVDQRVGLTQKAAKSKWTRETLRGEIKKLKAAKQITLTPEPDEEKLAPASKGVVGVYQIIEQEGCLKLDLGFSCYLDATRVAAKRFKTGELSQFKDSKFVKAAGLTTQELFTYNAIVTEVIDGDTFHCLIDLGFGITLKERVRLRRLNAPDVLISEGQRAKKVLEKILNRSGNSIVIKVSKTDDHDQYGRYLVDVWIGDACIDQELLDSGAFEVRGGE